PRHCGAIRVSSIEDFQARLRRGAEGHDGIGSATDVPYQHHGGTGKTAETDTRCVLEIHACAVRGETTNIEDTGQSAACIPNDRWPGFASRVPRVPRVPKSHVGIGYDGRQSRRTGAEDRGGFLPNMHPVNPISILEFQGVRHKPQLFLSNITEKGGNAAALVMVGTKRHVDDAKAPE
ncbi:hypothetical protein THAOC_02793, partial [Thalassiosira oceanica]